MAKTECIYVPEGSIEAVRELSRYSPDDLREMLRVSRLWANTRAAEALRECLPWCGYDAEKVDAVVRGFEGWAGIARP